MPANRRPAAPGSSARPDGRGGAGASTSRTKAPPTTSATPRVSASKPGASRPATPRPATPRPSAAKPPGASAPGATKPARPQTSTPPPPPPPERRRSRYGFLLPEVLTVRALVLSVVVLLAFVLLLPTVRAYVNQTGELRGLQSDLTAAQAERADLQVELGRWDDTSYVVAQARERLSFIMPGETPYRVIDPESVVDDIDPATGQTVTDGAVGVSSPDSAPWYAAIWRSTQLAGEQPVGGEEAEDAGDKPADRPAEPTDGTEQRTPATGDNG